MRATHTQITPNLLLYQLLTFVLATPHKRSPSVYISCSAEVAAMHVIPETTFLKRKNEYHLLSVINFWCDVLSIRTNNKEQTQSHRYLIVFPGFLGTLKGIPSCNCCTAFSPLCIIENNTFNHRLLTEVKQD